MLTTFIKLLFRDEAMGHLGHVWLPGSIFAFTFVARQGLAQEIQDLRHAPILIAHKAQRLMYISISYTLASCLHDCVS